MRGSPTDLLVLAALVGWLGGRATRDQAWDVGATATAAMFATLVLASVLAQSIATAHVAAPGGWNALEVTHRWITGAGGVPAQPFRPGVAPAIRLAAGIGLFVMAAEICRSHRGAGAMVMLVIGIAAAAVLNLNRFLELVLRQGQPWLQSALELHRTVRVSATIPDLNAAGALFALGLPIALSIASQPSREFRLLGGGSAVLAASGLWLSGSRAAMVAGAVAALAAIVLQPASRRRRHYWIAIATMLSVMLGAWVWYPRTAAHTSPSSAWLIRQELAVVSWKMAAEAPIFGAGIGQFYDRSAALASPTLQKHYVAENAHNQWLQVLGELGFSGLGLFLMVLGVGLWRSLQRLKRGRASAVERGTTLGLLAFLASSLLMHPLLVADPGAAFWLALGAARGLSRDGAEPVPVRWPLHATAFIICLVVLGLVVPRAGMLRANANLEGVSVGLSRWHVDHADGIRFRTATGRAAIFIPASASRVKIPLRANGRAGDHKVQLQVDGREAGQFQLRNGHWTEITLVIPSADASGRYRRLEVGLEERGSTLDVGRETVY